MHRHRQPPPVSDTELIARLDDLIVSNSRNIARSYSLSQEDIEDICQTVRLRLCRVDPQHRRNIPYCQSVVYNTQRDAIRQLKRHNTGLLSLEEPEDGAAAKWTISEDKLPPSSLPSLDAVIDTHTVAGRAWKKLSAEQQLCIAIRLGLDGAEECESPRTISRRTGIAESRIPGILRSAMATMQAAAKEFPAIG